MPEPTYRLLMEGEIPAGKPASTKRSAASKQQKHAPKKTPVEDEQDVSPNQELAKKILEEEIRNLDGGLLSSDAPQEIASE